MLMYEVPGGMEEQQLPDGIYIQWESNLSLFLPKPESLQFNLTDYVTV